jgi:hypothetical protein
MALTVPSYDAVNYELQNRITQLSTLITNNAGNGKLVFDYTKQKSQLQMQLVLGLLGQGSILASNMLTNETYAKAQPGGDQ